MFVVFYIFPSTFSSIDGYGDGTMSGTSTVPGINTVGCEKGKICLAAVLQNNV